MTDGDEVEQQVNREYSKYYKPNYEQQIEDTQFKLERLQLLREIADIDAKLRILESMYPPQKADEEGQPSAVHSAPTS